MKKQYMNPSVKVIKLIPESMMIGTSGDPITDENAGQFQGSRKMGFFDDEEE